MLSSILKCIDIARLVGAGIRCPMCNSTRCQQSKWGAKHEKLSSVSYRPYRCDDCNYRFLTTTSAALERSLINGAAAVLLILGALVAADLWLNGLDEQKIRQLELESTLHLKQGTAGDEAQGRTTEAPPNGRRAPEALAKKRQEAAANGDAAAMLALGRDLATGNKLPKDVVQAAKWVQLAAATGHPEGMLELGRFYRDGVGLAKDSVRAYVWFNRAAAAKHLAAIHERDDLVRTMSDEKLREAHQFSLAAEPLAGAVRRRQKI